MALPSLFVFVHSSSLGDFSCWLPSLIVASAPKEQSLPAAGKTSVHYHSIAICHGYEEAKVKLHFYTARPRGVANGQKERRRYYSIISPVLAAAAAKPTSHLGEGEVVDAVHTLGGLHHHHRRRRRLVGRVHLYLCEEQAIIIRHG